MVQEKKTFVPVPGIGIANFCYCAVRTTVMLYVFTATKVTIPVTDTGDGGGGGHACRVSYGARPPFPQESHLYYCIVNQVQRLLISNKWI